MLAMESVKLSLEAKTDNTVQLREREAKLSTIIGALRKIQETQEWSSLKDELFDPLVKTLERELENEAKREEPDTLKLNRIAGQLKWAEKYSDLRKLETVFAVELTNIKKLIHGKREDNG